MKFALIIFLVSSVTLASPKKTQALSYSELVTNASSSDWRTVDTSNLLYLELPTGRVVIELSPDFAPRHVENVKALAREKYWDGLAIVRVQDNYVVQWADPNSEKPELKRAFKLAKPTLEAEFDRSLDPKIPFTALKEKDIYANEVGFSNGFAVGRDPKSKKMWLLHCYGAIGAGRDVATDSGGGSELYAVIGQAPRHLDRNVTVLGRVISGMEYLSSLPRGHGPLGFYEKPEQQIPIESVKLATDLPEKERTLFEVLKTESPLFKKLIEARAHRNEEWFHYSPGHIDICNVPIPVREKK